MACSVKPLNVWPAFLGRHAKGITDHDQREQRGERDFAALAGYSFRAVLSSPMEAALSLPPS
ncbi:hypothetical protein ACFY4C_42200 [Actinomadura viridis]|uniref:hypothetical protein n=1 Tax=Actinomadura viridis TaxID=58110 RepID=UPI0036CFF8C1